VALSKGRLKLSRQDALEIPESTKQLRRVLESSLQKVRIEHLLRFVDEQCRFTAALRASGKPSPSQRVLLAALIAHGTNLGITRGVEGGRVNPPVFVLSGRPPPLCRSKINTHIPILEPTVIWDHEDNCGNCGFAV